MITITKRVIKQSDCMFISLKGHANYAPLGQDIVCSAVSILYQTLLISLKEWKINVKEKGDNEIHTLVIKKPTYDAQILIQSFFWGLKEIAKVYPNHVQIV